MIKIIADSTCDIVDKMLEKNNLYTFEPVALPIILDDVEYIEKYDESRHEQRDGYLDAMEKSPTVPKSSAPSPGVFLNSIENNNCETIFIICMTSKLSVTYSNALLAKQMYEDGVNKNKKIFVIDSLGATAACTNIVLQIIEKIENNIRPEQIFSDITNYVENEMRFYVILQSLKNLEKNGRVKPSIAKLATLMSLRPICKATCGELALAFKPHSSRAYKKMVDIITSDDVDFANRILTITHVRAPELAHKLKEEVSKLVKFKDIIIAHDPSCICINYGERGGIMLAY